MRDLIGRPDPRRALMLGAVVMLLLAVALFSRFGLDEELRRDEAVFAYAGQQLAEGVPPYVSILDAKTPLASFVAGGAVATGRTLGVDDLVAIRLAFFVVACLTVVAIHATATLLFGSVAAGLAASTAFLTFEGFAIDALGGPNAKTPGVLLAVVTTALLVERRWFAAGFTASLALLVWQPLAVYALVAILAALLGTDAGDRRRSAARALTGVAIPGLATIAYFTVAGALPQLVEGAVLLPTVGRQPAEGDLVARVGHIVEIVSAGYGFGGAVVWVGLAGIAGFVAGRVVQLRREGRPLRSDPTLLVVGLPLGGLLGLSLIDFQGYPDVYPLLPYAALGIGGLAAAVLGRARQRISPSAIRAGATALLAFAVVATWLSYSAPRPEASALVRQRADAADAERLLRPGDVLRVLGSPAPLVLMGRRNPSPAIYLSAGIDRWVVEHFPGGFDAWATTIADGSDMVVVGGWTGDYLGPMRQSLRTSFQRLRIGELELYVTPDIRERALTPVAGPG